MSDGDTPKKHFPNALLAQIERGFDEMVSMIEILLLQPVNNEMMKTMKRLILCAALSAFVCSLQAGESDTSKPKPASADKPAACCAAKAAACPMKSEMSKTGMPACCKPAKAQQATKVLMSPKAASEAGQ